MPDLVEVVKQIAAQTQRAQRPVELCYGQVLSDKPLLIRVDQKLSLPGAFFVIPRRLTDHTVEVSVDWGTGTEGTHPHSHRVAGRKAMTVHNGLKAGDKLILLAVQQGQKYLILDRVV